MPTIDLREKKELLVRREDIISTIRTNITDGEILDDIVESIERQVVARCSELGRVAIPFFGAFAPNIGKLDAIEHQDIMKAHRDVMSKEDYEEFKFNHLRARFKVRRGLRSRTIVINKTIRLNKNHAARMVRKFKNNSDFRLYMWLFAHSSATDTIEYYSSRPIDYA